MSVVPSFNEAVKGFLAGDFSRLEPLVRTPPDGTQCPVVDWFDRGLFDTEPKALAEAFSCACFSGCVGTVEYLLSKGVDPAGGSGTGMSAIHWAANRGQLKAVEILLKNQAPLESLNAYGGTVLDCAVWSAINEPKHDHYLIIESLVAAGANVHAVGRPSDDRRIEILGTPRPPC